MIIVKRNRLSPSQINKVEQPVARNTGSPVNFAAAAREAKAFLDEQPNLLRETGALLNESRNGDGEPR